MGREWDEEIESNEDDFSSEDEIRSIFAQITRETNPIFPYKVWASKLWMIPVQLSKPTSSAMIPNQLPKPTSSAIWILSEARVVVR